MTAALDARRLASAGSLRGGAIASRAVVGLILARFLGAAEFGVYVLAIAAAGLVALVARAGLDRLALAEIGTRPEAARTVAVSLGRPLLVGTVVVVAPMLVLVAVVPLPAGLDRAALAVAVAAAVPLNVVLFAAQVLRGARRPAAALVVGELGPPVARLLAFAVLPMSLSATRAALAFLAGWTALAIGGVLVVARLGGDDDAAERSWSPVEPWRRSGSLFVFALGAQLRELLAGAAGWAAGTPAEVGGLGTATRLEQMSLLPTTATRFVTAPELASRGATLPAATVALAVTTARRSLAVQLPLLIGIGLFAPQLLGLLGADFRPAADLLRVLVVGALVNSLTGSTTQTLLMSDRRDRLAASSLVGVGVLVVGAAGLAPSLGVLGVALAVAAANAVTGLVEWWYVRRDLGARVDVLAEVPTEPTDR
ncbi:MAG: polysaccharide biosynthesis C-terminal domain-containing protein [Actinomycetota bacterium]